MTSSVTGATTALLRPHEVLVLAGPPHGVAGRQVHATGILKPVASMSVRVLMGMVQLLERPGARRRAHSHVEFGEDVV